MTVISSPTSTAPQMRAIVQTEYGSPEVVLQLAEVDRPALPQPSSSDTKVMVRVQATAVHAGDWHLMRGRPFLVRLIYGGLRRPRINILGCDLAGEVIAVGQAVTRFKPGDQVFGELSESGFGAFAEYVTVPEKALVLKPTNLTCEEAATVPSSALAALQGLRDLGRLQPGQKVLVNGASGGVGSFAVQIAKAFGAEVTAGCSPGKAKMVRTLGADTILDNSQDFPSGLERQHYDLILDTAAFCSVFDYLPALTPTGAYVLVGGDMKRLFQAMLLSPWITKLGRRTVKCLASKPNPEDLLVLKTMIEAGQIRPHIDRIYPLSDVPAAIRALEQRQVQGKIAIRVAV
jgi:NADPH:quinone reductase-like Zn-dependent oxidoreductase